MSTGNPSVDFVLDALPAAEAMLDTLGQPQLATVIAALGATLKAASDAYEAKGFNLATALSAADAAAMATLLLKFPKH